MTEDDGCRCYRHINFSDERAERIGRIRGLVEHYGSQSMNVTVRQIYYQFVARGWAPSGDRTYSQVQADLNDGRMAGLVPWHYVVDRGRGLRGLRTHTSPAAAVRSVRATYRTDLWATQEWRPEVWVEKAALEGVIGDICSADDIRADYYATRGYDSQSQQYEAGQRLAGYVRRGQRPIIFHLGDHDPSGVDMTRDVQERLSLFAGVPVIVQRLALTLPQIERYTPPPFPVKWSDARARSYIERYGDDAWELDALEPSVLRDLIREAISVIKDPAAWDDALAQETDDMRELDDLIAGAEDEDEG